MFSLISKGANFPQAVARVWGEGREDTVVVILFVLPLVQSFVLTYNTIEVPGVICNWPTLGPVRREIYFLKNYAAMMRHVNQTTIADKQA